MFVWSGRSPDFGNEKYVVCAGSSLLPNCPAILVLEFLSIEMNLHQYRMNFQLLYPGGGGGAHLPPASGRLKCEIEIISVRVGWVMMHNRNSKFQWL